LVKILLYRYVNKSGNGSTYWIHKWRIEVTIYKMCGVSYGLTFRSTLVDMDIIVDSVHSTEQ